jgi:hypothetical protein
VVEQIEQIDHAIKRSVCADLDAPLNPDIESVDGTAHEVIARDNGTIRTDTSRAGGTKVPLTWSYRSLRAWLVE